MLNEKEQAILSILEIDPFISQQQMAERLGCSRSLIANLLSGLQEKGYILGKPYLLRKREVITCMGGANLDYKLRLKGKLMEGTSNPVVSKVSYGGVMRNVSENLAHLGKEVSFMSLIGQDGAGDELYAYCAQFMHMYATERIKDLSTGKYIAILDEKGDLQVGYADMAIADGMDAGWIHRHLGHIRQGSWVIADCNMQKSGLTELIQLCASEHKTLVLIGISGPKMLHLLEDLTGTSLLICNRDESEAYFHTKDRTTEHLAEQWLARGVQRIVITSGSKPVVYGSEEGVSSVSVPAIAAKDIIDVTGAGDAFSAAVIDALIEGEDLKRAVQRGNQLASLTLCSEYSVLPQHQFPRSRP